MIVIISVNHHVERNNQLNQYEYSLMFFSIGPQNNSFSVIGQSDSKIQYSRLLSTTTQQPWLDHRISCGCAFKNGKININPIRYGPPLSVSFTLLLLHTVSI